MKKKLIKKTKTDFKKTPNLVDYQKTYRTFSWDQAEKELDWFPQKRLNAAHNAIDRHVQGSRKNKVALYWEGADGTKKKFTFYELYRLSNQFANLLKSLGIKKGERVFFFLPRVPALYFGFLGTLKTGAIAGTMFSAFGPKALLDRLENSDAKFLVTNQELYPRVDKIASKLPNLKKIILVENLEKLLSKMPVKFSCAKTKPDDPAFMLYTSGTTGKPKGVIHFHRAILHEHMTAKWVLDLQEDDVYWCVPPKTIVVSNPAPCTIEQVKIGDLVLGHDGRFHPVVRLYRRKYSGPLIKVKTRYSNIPMCLTPNHEVLAAQPGKKAIKWKPAGELTKKDFVLFPRIKAVNDLNKLSISAILKEYLVKDGKLQGQGFKRKIKDKIDINNRFMRLAGYYVAEGSLGAKGRMVQFSFSKNEEKWVDDVLFLLKEIFGVKGTKIFINNLVEARVNSVIIAKLFSKLFGKKAPNKKLPSWCLYLPDEKISGFIKGFWRGDGDTDRDRFRFCTTSRILAYQLKLILHRLGLTPTFCFCPVEKISNSRIGKRTIKARHGCYYLAVGGRSLKKLSKLLGVKHPFLKKRGNTYQYARVTPNYIWMPISSIQEEPYLGEVFNLETKASSYSLNNMVVHNCTADPGWVTGIAYEILGSWSNGASSVVYQGRFDPAKWYEIIQEYKVNVWYTAPTAIRMLAATGLNLVRKYDLSSLRHLASVGEPLNPEAIYWGLKAFSLPFHDNWWQTETGGILIANYPCLDIKPGSMGKPVPGVVAAVVNDKGKKLPANQIGNLAIKPGWPSMMGKIWRRPKKYQSYFIKGMSRHERGAKRRVEWYISGDLAYQDKDGYFWFVSRDDDVIKTAGERVGPFEVESALISHPKIIEAGVIGKPDPMRGQIIKAFVALKEGVKGSKSLKDSIKKFVKKELAGHAYPREIEFVKSLPKTRSGKIVRRFLKAQELGLPLGDTSTLEKF